MSTSCLSHLFVFSFILPPDFRFFHLEVFFSVLRSKGVDFRPAEILQTNGNAGTIFSFVRSTLQPLSAQSTCRSWCFHCKAFPHPTPGFPSPNLCVCLSLCPTPPLAVKSFQWGLMQHHFLFCFRSLTFYSFLFSPLMFYLVRYSCSRLNGCADRNKYILPLTKSGLCPDLNLKICKSCRVRAG